MPILDHLSPEILDIADFDAFHSQWASKIVTTLNHILPKGFRAKAHTSIGTREVDIRTDASLGDLEKQRLETTLNARNLKRYSIVWLLTQIC